MEKSILKLVLYIKQKCLENNLTIAVAESCTGGLLSSYLTNISGSSKYFRLGLITYSNESKINLLNVDKKIIQKFGAVSENTAIAMACGLEKLSKADIVIAVTGIAGPTGGSKEKPVGTVFLSIKYKDKIFNKKIISKGVREIIKTNTSKKILKLIKYILNK